MYATVTLFQLQDHESEFTTIQSAQGPDKEYKRKAAEDTRHDAVPCTTWVFVPAKHYIVPSAHAFVQRPEDVRAAKKTRTESGFSFDRSMMAKPRWHPCIQFFQNAILQQREGMHLLHGRFLLFVCVRVFSLMTDPTKLQCCVLTGPHLVSGNLYINGCDAVVLIPQKGLSTMESALNRMQAAVVACFMAALSLC